MRHTVSVSSVVAGLVLVVSTACSSAAQSPKAQGGATPEVVATVGGQPITLADVDRIALKEPASAFGGAKLEQALFMARQAAVDEIVGNRLMDAEAKSRGVTRAALVEQEIAAKAPNPKDADVTAWYQANPARVQGAPLEQVREPIRSLLIQERMNAARTSFIDALKRKTPVTISLEPPRVEVADGGRPAKGPANAPVEIIEFSDFQCPFCQRAYPTVQQVFSTYGDRVKFVYRHYPLPNHPNARPAAEAAACAQDQGKFWEYHDRLFTNAARLSDADLKQHAVTIGLDTAKFNNCFDTHQHKADVDADVAAANEAGVTGTPAFFINGRSLEGAQPFEAFRRVIKEELARKK